MRSLPLEAALTDFFAQAGAHLRAEVAAGAEVPFEVGARTARRSGSAGTLYCYRALTGPFIEEREPALRRLPAYAEAARLLEHFDGLERYLRSAGAEAGRAQGPARARMAISALLREVFEEQSEFELRSERVRATLERLQGSALAKAGELALVADLHGVAIASPELPLATGLRILHRDALAELPGTATPELGDEPAERPPVVLFTAEPDDPAEGLDRGRAVLRDLLSALRLFGDGRVTLGPLAWARVGSGPWVPLALGVRGRPHGMLLVTAEQEDELRAFCNLVSRRAPHDNDLAWALRRFELACERESPFEGLTDNLLALRALLEPEGPASGRLAGRIAALCATAEQRAELTERMVRAIALERSLIAGTAVKNGASQDLAEEVARHLRSLLRDVICGHLDPDLAVIADELLEPDELLHVDEEAESPRADPVPAGAAAAIAQAPIPAAGACEGELRARRVRERPLRARVAEPWPEDEAPGEGDFIGASELATGLDADREQPVEGVTQADATPASGADAAQRPLPIDGVVSWLS